MKNVVKFSGKILFDPKDKTSKHHRQSDWKKVAIVLLEPELNWKDKGISDYYAWFIKKRFGIKLQSPLRNAHVTIVNDKDSETNGKWEEIKKKWNGKELDVYLNVDPFVGIKNRGDNTLNWWLTVPNEHREELYSIRKELGLKEKPYFGFHMTIGRVFDSYPDFSEDYEYPKQYTTSCIGLYTEQSEYIINAAKKGKLNLGD